MVTDGKIRLNVIGDCNICAEQKILFINEMKQFEIWPRPTG